MKKMTLTISAIALLTIALGGNLLASAEDAAATTAAQQSAKITLTEAINIAEQTTGGKATEAEFELEDGQAVYEVEVAMVNGSEVELEIDAQSGAVLSQEVEDDD